MNSLSVRNIVKNYGSFRAIKDVSFEVDPGEFIVMVGPSGCGKSTLLRSIAGLETITSGRVEVNGRDITGDEPANRGVAMVFQNYALYPHMTVRKNMGFALSIAGRPKAEIDAAVERAAGILRITDHLEKKPRQLSGGQKQRVAIGRAITRSPEVFLFDEPLSNLDAALRTQMRVELGRLHAELGATMVYVTHDQTEAMTMADRIVVLHDGEIEQLGAPLDLYNRPANRFVAGFLGSPRMNFIEAAVTGVQGRSVSVAAPGLTGEAAIEIHAEAEVPRQGDKVIIGVRPEGFGAAGEPGWSMDTRVAVVESLGRETIVYVDAGELRAFDSESHEGYFAVYRSAQLSLGHGEALGLTIPARSVYLFAESGTTLAWPDSAEALPAIG
ncbi:ABC transporter ATP-binding protein [Marinovum sp.]|uniref:ABC transporter ATP-binding protein n=1 Tax=Marinovum sp. TaxID=2024839 RepID=UPI002B27303A|nr:ABC transporter ATP-binding protein [Marinovum sp.]